MGRLGFFDSIEDLFFHKPVPCHFIGRIHQMKIKIYQNDSVGFWCFM